MSRRTRVALAVAVLLGLGLVLVSIRWGRAPRSGGAGALPPAAPGGAPSATAPTATPAAPRSDPSGAHATVILSAPWGAADGQLGRRADPESLVEGPMSFIADANGLAILDNVNRRVARFDRHGRPLPPIALPTEAAQDLARGAHDRLAVLDRLHDRRVTLFDRDGQVRATLPLVGAGISEPAAVTGLFADGHGDLFAEREHGAWLHLADGDGHADAMRASAPGRPTRDGHFVSAAILDRAAGRVRVRLFADAESPPVWETTVDAGAPLLFLALLDGDAAGRIYLGAHSGRESTSPPYRIEDESLTLVALSPAGVETRRLTLPAPPAREEAFRDLYVGDDGTIYWMRRTAAGVVVEAYSLSL